MRALVVLAAALAPAAAAADAWAPIAARGPDLPYAAVDRDGATTRLEGGRSLGPGEVARAPDVRLEPGEYKIRLLFQGDARPSDSDVAVIVDDGRAPRRLERAVSGAPTFRVAQAGSYAIRVENRGSRPLGVAPPVVLRRERRDPVQVILCVPDAYAPFPDARPDALYARVRPEGTFHAAFYASGDNTVSFTRTLFRRPAAGGEPVARALRRHGMLTASISDNFYLLADVEAHDLDQVVVLKDSKTSDAEIAARAVEWVRQRGGEDFLLYVHFLAEHGVVGLEPREDADEVLTAAVRALRAAAPRALVVVAPDHGPMTRHAWAARGRLSGGQGWGLYSDTQHIPLVASGPGIAPGRRCDRRWSWADLRDRLAAAGPRGAGDLARALDCGGPDRDQLVVEGWHQQIAVTDRRHHYVSYDPTVPYPMYSVATGLPVRDRFLDGEALFDVARDPDEAHSIGSERPDELLRYRLVAAEERRKRFPGVRPGSVLRLMYLSPRCEPPRGPITIRSSGTLALDARTGAGVVARSRDGALVLQVGSPWCFRDVRVEVGEPTMLEVELPGGDLFLGAGLLRRRERVRLEGANALGLLSPDARGVEDVFVRNGARAGLYVFLEPAPAHGAAPGAVARRSGAGANASAEDVRRMMRSWGYMREAESTDLQ